MINQVVKGLITASIALFFSLIVFNNLNDFNSNKIFVMKTMNLETIQNDVVAWRAIKDQNIQMIVYWSFILWEAFTAISCWIGAYFLIRYDIKKWALIGITMGFILYMVGFVTMASEWFYLWQSVDFKETQIKGLLFSLLMIGCLSFISSENK